MSDFSSLIDPIKQFSKMIALFKLPPEIITLKNQPPLQYYPANLAQLHKFNCEDYTKCKTSDADISDELLSKKIKQIELLRRDSCNILPNQSIDLTRARLAQSKKWGELMEQNGRTVVAWNKHDPDSIAMSEGTKNIIWLENGYFRTTHLFCEPKINLVNIKTGTPPNQTPRSKIQSILLNAADMLINEVDRYGCLGYYLQVASKKANKIHLQPYRKKPEKKAAKMNMVFLAQLDYDANTIINGNGLFFQSAIESFNELIKTINENKIDCKGFIRLHPNSSLHYRRSAKKQKQLQLDETKSMEECAEFYDAAVTINSSAAISFIENLKPVLFLGQGELAEFMSAMHIAEHSDMAMSLCNPSQDLLKSNFDSLAKFKLEKHIPKGAMNAYIQSILKN